MTIALLPHGHVLYIGELLLCENMEVINVRNFESTFPWKLKINVMWLWANITAMSNGNLVSWKDVFNKNETLKFGDCECEELWRWEVDTIAQTLESTHKWDSKVNPRVSFTDEFSQNPLLKNMISTHRKDFPWKKWTKFARFWKKNSINRQIFITSSSRWQKI
jgi:hypothetical protein